MLSCKSIQVEDRISTRNVFSELCSDFSDRLMIPESQNTVL